MTLSVGFTEEERIEWDPSAVEPSDEVFVFGYPSLAGHQPGVEVTEAEVAAVLPLWGADRNDERKSIVLSAKNIPGHSGGPWSRPTDS